MSPFLKVRSPGEAGHLVVVHHRMQERECDAQGAVGGERQGLLEAEVVYGPGRHDISNSIFFYYLDPDGLTVEYSFGMEEFPEHTPRDARQLPPKPEILDSWGGMPAPKFGKGGTVERTPL